VDVGCFEFYGANAHLRFCRLKTLDGIGAELVIPFLVIRYPLLLRLPLQVGQRIGFPVLLAGGYI
jgi:hypothetical protein